MCLFRGRLSVGCIGKFSFPLLSSFVGKEGGKSGVRV